MIREDVRTVLVVEDDVDTAELERRTLVRAGIDVTLAPSVREAKMLLRAKSFDAVLLDYQLPDGNAWQIVELAQSLTPRVPVVLVTSMGSETIVAEAMHRGVADYVRKSDNFWHHLPDTVLRVARMVDIETRLRHSDALFQSLAEHATDIIVTLDLAGRVRYIAPSIQALLNRNPSDLVGHSFLDIVATAHRGHDQFMEYPRKLQGRATFQCQSACDEGPWVEANFQIIRNSGTDQIEEILGILRDITERIRADDRLRESEERFRGAFETAAHGMALVSTDGRWLRVNRALCEIVGYSEAELLASDFQTITHPEDLDADLAHVQDLVSGHSSSYQMEKRYLHKNGATIWILLSVSLVRDAEGAPLHFVSQIIDISPRKRIEAALVEAKDAADRGNRAKAQFLANMSHEIRTPMNGVIGIADLLLADQLSNEQMRKVSLLKDSAKSLLAILDDILDFSKIDAGKLVFDSVAFEVRRVAEGALEIVKPLAGLKPIGFELSISPSVPEWLTGDSVRLRQVLVNLLSNAIKNTETGTISLFGSSDGLMVTFEIRDTGAGISHDMLHLLFQNFSQLEQGARRRQGTGLGLAISKRLTEGMGGAIEVESEVGKGSTFRFSIPQTPAARPAHGGKKLIGDTRQLAILVAEDLELNRIVIEAMLKLLGHQVVLVGDGQEALTAVQVQHFDIVLMDVEMPVMGGLEAARGIRNLTGPMSQVPIIAVTANAMREEIDLCIASGINDHIAKPIDRQSLAAILARWSDHATLD